MPRDNHYLETEVFTASPHRLHLLVVEGAIRHTRAAAAALDVADLEQAHYALSSARDCIGELIGGLDPERDPELVERLKALFVFVYRQCVEADRDHDPQLVRNALRILELHRATWIELGDRLRQEQQAPCESPGAGTRSWLT